MVCLAFGRVIGVGERGGVWECAWCCRMELFRRCDCRDILAIVVHFFVLVERLIEVKLYFQSVITDN